MEWFCGLVLDALPIDYADQSIFLNDSRTSSMIDQVTLQSDVVTMLLRQVRIGFQTVSKRFPNSLQTVSEWLSKDSLTVFKVFPNGLQRIHERFQIGSPRTDSGGADGMEWNGVEWNGVSGAGRVLECFHEIETPRVIWMMILGFDNSRIKKHE